MFTRYFVARLLESTSYQLVVVALSQFVYDLTHDPMALGLAGLSVFLAKLIFTIPAGNAADHFLKPSLMALCRLASATLLLLFCALLMAGWTPIWAIYAILFAWGALQAFDGPAGQSLVPDLVSAGHFANAVTWNSAGQHLSSIAGPILCGTLYALTAGPKVAILIAMLFSLVSAGLALKLPTNQIVTTGARGLAFAMDGLRYVFRTKTLLGVLSLDLFAVLFGGAVALLPVFANDILKVGPAGLGLLRAAPAAGGAVMALLLNRLPAMKNAGMALLSYVALFGLGTIAFGLSKNFWLSLALLFALGAFDMVSMVIRGVMVQLQTPPEMRGRVSAVNLIFIGASNELGEFESGFTAALFGIVPATVLGGIGTLVVVALWGVLFPEIRRMKTLR